MLTGTCHGVFEDWLEEILKGSAPSRRRRVLACQMLSDSGHPLSPFFYVFVWPNHNAGDVPNVDRSCRFQHRLWLSAPFMARIASDSGLRSALSDHMLRMYLPQRMGTTSRYESITDIRVLTRTRTVCLDSVGISCVHPLAGARAVILSP